MRRFLCILGILAAAAGFVYCAWRGGHALVAGSWHAVLWLFGGFACLLAVGVLWHLTRKGGGR